MNQSLIWFWTFGREINAWSSNLTVQKKKKKMSVKSFFFYYAFSTWVQPPCMIREKCSIAHKGGSKFVYSCWCTLVNNVAGKKMLYHRLWWAPARAAQIAIIQKKKGAEKWEGLVKKLGQGEERWRKPRGEWKSNKKLKRVKVDREGKTDYLLAPWLLIHRLNQILKQEMGQTLAAEDTVLLLSGATACDSADACRSLNEALKW